MELLVPDKEYYRSYIEAVKEYKFHKVTAYEFLDVDRYDIFERIRDFKEGNNLPDGYVKATYLWLIDEGEFAGEVSIRHSLTESLLRFGGNIG